MPYGVEMSLSLAAIAAFSVFSLLGGSAAERCAMLPDRLNDADIMIDDAAPVTAAGDLPAYCRVRGTLRPNIGFEMRLPLKGWNRKYFQSGCGGFCGKIVADSDGRSNTINHALRRGYAAMTTDGGHQAAHIGVAEWAYENDEAEKQYADASIARAYEAGQVMAKALYGKRPRYSYFSGCSNGGRMAAIAAQRYPDLFDGIISGCPALTLSRAGGVFGAWVLQANQGPDGAPVLDEAFAAKIPLLERAVLEQCDGIDGAHDGLISAPFECQVEISRIPICAGRSSVDCLTTDEAAVVEKWWRGPHNSVGEKLFSGMPPGGERFWPVWYLGSAQSPRVGTMLADGYLKYLGFEVDDAQRQAADFNFDRDIGLLEGKGALFDATDPDLTAFRDAGGKMIMWHGLADPLVVPYQSVEYYQSVAARMGGDRKVQEFFRLFLAPGLGHCWEAPGAGPDDFDPLSALEKWVEARTPPEEILSIPSSAQVGSVAMRMVYRPYPAMAEAREDTF